MKMDFKIMLILLVCFVNLYLNVNAFKPMFRDVIVPGKRSKSYHFSEKCNKTINFVQRVDHFNFKHDDLYLQRYILSTDNWKVGGPIFFYTGNEGDIQWFCDNTGFVWEIAPKFNAMVVFAEHRYYGNSMPYGNDSMKQPYINYLTSAQALADYAYLITFLKQNITGASESPVVVFGGSYGGMLSAWFRMKYPNLAVGAIAASAPIWQMISDCDSFASGTTNTFKRADPLCADIVRTSWSILNDMGKTKDGLKQIETIFKLCKPLKSVGPLKDWLNDIYGSAAMSDYPYPTSFLNPLPANPVQVMCANITSVESLSDPIAILNGIYKGINVYSNYTGTSKCFDIDSDTPSDINMYAWTYQTCTEFVFPTCTNGVIDMFENTTWDYNVYVKNCHKLFKVIPRPEWPIIYYNGKNIKAHSNIVFSNGDLDPWSNGGVLVNITSKLPAYIIQGGAHHLDLRSSNPSDPISVKQVRQAEIDLIQEWIKKY